MQKIFVSGSLAYDRIMDFEGLFSEHILPEKTHSLSVSFFVPRLTESFGGCAGNIAYTLSLFGAESIILGTAGNDFEPYERWLAEHAVDTSMIQKDISLRTAFATIMTDKADNQIAAFYPGAMQVRYDFTGVPFAQTSLVVVSPSNPEAMRELPALCRKLSFPFIFDPGQQIPILSPEDLKNGLEAAKAIIVNDYELELLSKKTDWGEKDFLAHVEILVVTLGEKGSRIYTKEKTIEIPAARPKAVVDPTGAGDAYRAGFIYGLLSDLPLETAGKLGAVAACYTVEAEGTQTHRFRKEDFSERYFENFNESVAI